MADGTPTIHKLDETLPAQPMDRRRALLMGLGLGVGFIAGCSGTPTRTARMPNPAWPADSLLAPSSQSATGGSLPPAVARAPQSPLMERVIARSNWTKGLPDKGEINPMLPVHWITVHHDGMDAFTATDHASCASRIELIRNGHRGKGWADIGYHFVIDRSGRVWEGRDLCWQGAHVKNRNEGNIGILCLGNFDVSRPSTAQLQALERHAKLVMRHYKLSPANVRSHKEWPEAATACPGRNLQSKMSGLRRALA
jgi:hypothetical protein